ncbi:conserved Plasmodium protein, unknown function [Plasmodium vivax]|uniref:(malaria parasite P. vivax) hypothetical protein n=1 Tax=Plasmodium vivax TaxID=5855 RepID=A0A1G4H1A5_PLAVI|nr:unnamed protein product [Plasmodium vivax]CAI7722074.1 conserved Plasmodium protein, unknown function [Plasmodium vivax]SCO68644.1 conserved Plasmodium protein, unknown function [Plasmodium vivax]SCO74107.1 conserved Plasmodium protein, unknown function [Plasmodium vivax]VUZ97540.1 conserved Plasmodium protein, unknown function [Plasmodium vivax]
MNFDDFVNVIYGKDVFNDENSHYVRESIFPYLLPLVTLVNNEKEKHKYFNVFYDYNEKERPLMSVHDKKSDDNIEQVDIFSTDKLKASSAELLEIQQEVLKKYVNINPILALSEYLIEEYNKKNEDKKTSE